MARSTVFRYKGRDADALAVGRELRVRGGAHRRVKHVGDRLQSSTWSWSTPIDGSQLWGETYNRHLSDLVQLQDEMSREIVEKLRLKLTGAEKKKLRKNADREHRGLSALTQGALSSGTSAPRRV